MNLFEKIIDFLSYQLPYVPQPYGTFHLVFLGLTVLICLFIGLKFSHSTDKQDKNILLFFSILLLSFEVYKQLVFTIEKDVWSYQWYAFPFQFCSVPMYVAFITAFLKPGKIKNAFYNFLGTFCLFAGLAAMFYPDDVFISTLGISIQTMVHHGSMVIIGFYCLISGRTTINKKSIIGSGIVFSVLFLMALGMNLLFKNVNGTFNMFFISPYYQCHLPVLSQIQSQFGYVVFLLSYLLGFIFIAYLILLIALGIKNWHYKAKSLRKLVKAN
ncbi:MAG: hypothetical protein AB7V00_01165 [Bacilli bacterium]